MRAAAPLPVAEWARSYIVRGAGGRNGGCAGNGRGTSWGTVVGWRVWSRYLRKALSDWPVVMSARFANFTPRSANKSRIGIVCCEGPADKPVGAPRASGARPPGAASAPTMPPVVDRVLLSGRTLTPQNPAYSMGYRAYRRQSTAPNNRPTRDSVLAMPFPPRSASSGHMSAEPTPGGGVKLFQRHDGNLSA